MRYSNIILTAGTLAMGVVSYIIPMAVKHIDTYIGRPSQFQRIRHIPPKQ